jgi:hypothetical protein
MGQKRKMPRVNNIFDHWRWKLGLEWDDKDICWGCGFKTEYLQRCHIHDHWESHNDDVSNLLLLCKFCHKLQEICCRTEESRKEFIESIIDGAPFMTIRMNDLFQKWKSGIYDNSGIYDLTYRDYLKLEENNK